MTGAATFVIIAAISGIEVGIPRPLMMSMIAVIGIMAGSNFTPEFFTVILQLLPSLAGMTAAILSMHGLVYIYFRKIAGYDHATAFFTGAPGGLTEMMLVGERYGAHTPTLVLTHTVRILVIVFTIPFLMRIFYGALGSPLTSGVKNFNFGSIEVVMVILCFFAGFAARRLRVPAGWFIGPLIVSALFHITELSGAKVPPVIVAIAQLVIGTALGSRLSGVNIRAVSTTLKHAVITALIMAFTAYFLSCMIALAQIGSFDELLLSYGPGGVPEMTIAAISMNIDPTIVATHHVVRLIVVLTVLPLIFRLFLFRKFE